MSSPPVRITLGSFTPSVLLDLARSTEALAAAGLEVHEQPVPSSPGQFEALAEGRLDVALTSPDNVLAYRNVPSNPLGRLLDARIVSAVDRGLGLGVYARPGAGLADLRGATVGVDVPTSGFALALYALLEDLGLPRGDYELVSLGSTPQRLRALLDGECAATMLGAGNELVAEDAECPLLASVGDRLAPYLGTVVAVVGDRHLDAAERLATVLLSTAQRIVAGELDDTTREAAARRLGLDDALADRYLARLRDPAEGLVPDGVVDRACLQTLVELRRRYLPGDGADHLAAALDDEGLVQAW